MPLAPLLTRPSHETSPSIIIISICLIPCKMAVETHIPGWRKFQNAILFTIRILFFIQPREVRQGLGTVS